MSLNGRLGSIMMRGMVIDMNDERLHTLAVVLCFLERVSGYSRQQLTLVTGGRESAAFARKIRAVLDGAPVA